MEIRNAVRHPVGTIAVVPTVWPTPPIYLVANGKARLPWMRVPVDPRNLTLREIRKVWRHSGIDSGSFKRMRARILRRGA